MRPSAPFLTVSRFLLTPAILSTLYLYLFPFLQQCQFPVAKRGQAACLADGTKGEAAVPAPFRLLALADPQLEGDSSLPDRDVAGWWPRVKEDGLISAVQEWVLQDVPSVLQGWRKRVDLWGNDLYLGHVYRSVTWWTMPTHVVVLGDLLGSQWIGDEEFARRSQRFWQKVFKDAQKVPRTVTDVSGRVEVLGEDEGWQRRVIAVAGNHDIGYAGDLDTERVERFERAFGPVNWEVRFRLNDSSATSSGTSMFSYGLLAPAPPELHLIILNSMNLDGPAWDSELRQQSLDFLTHQLHSQPYRRNSATVLLTHIPLHKKEGICVDSPYFSYYPEENGSGIREQNHLSNETSALILDGLLPPRRDAGAAIVLNGHDHYGCTTYHYRPRVRPLATPGDGEHHWQASPYAFSDRQRSNTSLRGLREITVQSMMGSFGGNAGLLSGWFDDEAGEWKFEYNTCMFGVQHIWWAVHVLDIITLLLGLAGVGSKISELVADDRRDEEKRRKELKEKAA